VKLWDNRKDLIKEGYVEMIANQVSSSWVEEGGIMVRKKIKTPIQMEKCGKNFNASQKDVSLENHH
jgi:hypothetical protein